MRPGLPRLARALERRPIHPFIGDGAMSRDPFICRQGSAEIKRRTDLVSRRSTNMPSSLTSSELTALLISCWTRVPPRIHFDGGSTSTSPWDLFHAQSRRTDAKPRATNPARGMPTVCGSGTPVRVPSTANAFVLCGHGFRLTWRKDGRDPANRKSEVALAGFASHRGKTSSSLQRCL
jgi:hypothetical protein